MIIVFDLANLNSFKNLDSWLKEIHNNTHKGIVITLVGNKSDLSAEEKEVSFKIASRYAKLTEMNYIEASAKNQQNVVEIFESSLSKVLEKLKSQEIVMDEHGTQGVV